MQGWYCGVETIDGGGKGTLVGGLADRFCQSEFKDMELFLVQEPNETKNRIGAYIRRCLQNPDLIPDPMTFQEYYMVDRYVTMVCDIRPALARGAVVLSDRTYFSTLAYGALNLPLAQVEERHRQMVGSVMRYPHLTIFVDVIAEEGVRRLTDRGKQLEHFEQTSKLAKVRQNYLRLMEEPRAVLIPFEDGFRPQQTAQVIIDGMAAPSVVLDRAWSVFSQHLRTHLAQQSQSKE